DIEGTFTIAKDGDQYTGILHGEQGDLNLDNVVIEDDDLVCTFDYNGYTIDMTGNFVGDTFTGQISVDYNEFLMSAVRKK
ncbi:MAG: hypothetical protein KAQ62_16030, partial [Cyclobacteriaceae bacterium]|nr:hypothetical protein [Cyclobacteriaceae bacterium]